MKILKSNKGFTLIELLVVIGILGILASVMVATIDPFEQLKKSDDSNLKNISVEFLNANMRYKMTHSAFPWELDGQCKTDTGATGDVATVLLSVLKGPTSCIAGDLVGDGELKSGYNTVRQLSKIFLTESTDKMYVCFLPTSKSGQNDPVAIFNDDGTDNSANCLDVNGKKIPPSEQVVPNNLCYWCAQ